MLVNLMAPFFIKLWLSRFVITCFLVFLFHEAAICLFLGHTFIDLILHLQSVCSVTVILSDLVQSEGMAVGLGQPIPLDLPETGLAVRGPS